MVDVQGVPAFEHVRQPHRPVGAFEEVVLLDFHHGQASAFGIDGIAQMGDLALAGQQLLAGRQPFLAGDGGGIGG